MMHLLSHNCRKTLYINIIFDEKSKTFSSTKTYLNEISSPKLSISIGVVWKIPLLANGCPLKPNSKWKDKNNI